MLHPLDSGGYGAGSSRDMDHLNAVELPGRWQERINVTALTSRADMRDIKGHGYSWSKSWIEFKAPDAPGVYCLRDKRVATVSVVLTVGSSKGNTHGQESVVRGYQTV